MKHGLLLYAKEMRIRQMTATLTSSDHEFAQLQLVVGDELLHFVQPFLVRLIFRITSVFVDELVYLPILVLSKDNNNKTILLLLA